MEKQTYTQYHRENNQYAATLTNNPGKITHTCIYRAKQWKQLRKNNGKRKTIHRQKPKKQIKERLLRRKSILIIAFCFKISLKILFNQRVSILKSICPSQVLRLSSRSSHLTIITLTISIHRHFQILKNESRYAISRLLNQKQSSRRKLVRVIMKN